MKNIITILVVIISLSSCEKLLIGEDLQSTNPKDNFDYLWKECDEKYAYFDLKNIDWDSVKSKYETKVYEGMTDDSLFQVMGAMLTELKDDHTNLFSSTDISSFGTDQLGQDNFDFRILKDNYLPKDLYRSGPFTHEFINGKNIGYVRFPAFTGATGASNLNFILERYENTDGLILDLRENGGGAVTDVFRLLNRFIDKKTLLYFSRIKNGPEHNNFSEAKEAFLEPFEGKRYTKKVMLLVDRGTYSAGSFTSLASKAIPSITLVGDTTGGGLGLPNGGQLPNGWKYRFSITQTLTLDKKPDYENGVPPDVYATIDWNDRTKDEVVEKAIELILN